MSTFERKFGIRVEDIIVSTAFHTDQMSSDTDMNAKKQKVVSWTYEELNSNISGKSLLPLN